jgi:Flp pilus assembly protein TadD
MDRSICRNLLGLGLVVGLSMSVRLAGQAGAVSPGSSTPEAALAAAEGVLRAGQAAEAERLFRALIAREPGIVEAHRGLAETLAAQKRGGEAAGVLLALGEGLIESGLYEPAAESLRRAAALAPTSGALAGRIQADLGRALVLDRKPASAVEALHRAASLGVADVRSLQYLGAALWESGNIEEAEAVYRRLASESGSALVLQELGRLLLWQGKAAEAAEVLRRASAADARAADTWVELGRALEATGQAREAEAAYRRAAELAPERSDAHYGLALLLARSGRPGAREEAARQMEVYRKLAAAERERTRNEGLEKIRLERGWALLREGRPQDAQTQFAALPESGESLAGLAAALAAAGDHAGAVTALERAVTLAPGRRDLRLKLAEQRLLAAERR